jgi:hypothetical protein
MSSISSIGGTSVGMNYPAPSAPASTGQASGQTMGQLSAGLSSIHAGTSSLVQQNLDVVMTSLQSGNQAKQVLELAVALLLLKALLGDEESAKGMAAAALGLLLTGGASSSTSMLMLHSSSSVSHGSAMSSETAGTFAASAAQQAYRVDPGASLPSQGGQVNTQA